MIEILKKLTEENYLEGPFTGPNHAKRRRLKAKARHRRSWHRQGHAPAPTKKHISKPHEARHLHCTNR